MKPVAVDMGERKRRALEIRASVLGVTPEALEVAERVIAAFDDSIVDLDALSYANLEKAYAEYEASAGREPRFVHVSPLTFSEISMKFQTQQRFTSAIHVGNRVTTAMKWNSAVILKDRTLPYNRLVFSDETPPSY